MKRCVAIGIEQEKRLRGLPSSTAATSLVLAIAAIASAGIHKVIAQIQRLQESKCT